jgi:hypothetical protein
MTEQPTALQLADWAASYNTTMHNKTAAELRRLHAVNAELLVALKWIATVNAMDYEYQAKARVAIARAEGKV